MRPSRRRSLARSRLAVGLVLGLGLAGVGCGPKQKFCPDAGDGVCRPPLEASAPSDVMDAPEDQGSIFIGQDSASATDTPSTTDAPVDASSDGDAHPSN